MECSVPHSHTTTVSVVEHDHNHSDDDDDNDTHQRCNNNDDVEDRIARLRIFLQHKPKNARAMAKLACLIASQRQQQQHPSVVANDPNVWNEEAVEWAERSIAAAPTKPYGHTALSILHPQFHVRMNALRRALQTCTTTAATGDDDHDRYYLVQIDLLVRLLLEPRAEQRRRHGLAGDPTTPHHTVTEEERVVISQIDAALDLVWNRHRNNKNNNNNNNSAPTTVVVPPLQLDGDTLEFLGQREYRLGRFFRRLEPTSVYRPKSQWYFEQAIHHLPPHHADQTMAQFWRATLVVPPLHTMDHDDDDDDNNGAATLSSSAPAWTKCPAEYIVGLYATFAPKFDQLLVGKLEYETPRMLRLLHDRVTVLEAEPHRRRYRAMADLGCGTGLSGLAFASLLWSRNDDDDDTTEVGTMTGVDLSPEMLALAAQKKCYQKLVTGDITSILQEPGIWDCVLACDVFCDIGELMPVFRLVHASLMPEGIFVFSNEKASDEFEGPFYLHECARFAHNKDYIVSLAESTGFQILTMQVCPIRKNKGKDVIGILTILKKLSI